MSKTKTIGNAKEEILMIPMCIPISYHDALTSSAKFCKFITTQKKLEKIK
jgi:hypothetical protein